MVTYCARLEPLLRSIVPVNSILPLEVFSSVRLMTEDMLTRVMFVVLPSNPANVAMLKTYAGEILVFAAASVQLTFHVCLLMFIPGTVNTLTFPVAKEELVAF